MKNMLSKTLVLVVIGILFLTTIPLVSANNNFYSTSKVTNIYEKDKPIRPSGLYNSILISTTGVDMLGIFMIMFLGGAKYYALFSTHITNFCEIPVNILLNLKIIDKKNNKTLLDYNTDTQLLNPGDMSMIEYATLSNFKYWGYTSGPFDILWKLNNSEANIDMTVVFHGFLYRFGAIIFNPDGELIK